MIYDIFLNLITDDMFLELDEVDTCHLLQDLLLNAIPQFEFPRFNIDNYEISYIEDEGTYCGVDSNYILVPCYISGGGFFYDTLTLEEMKILALYMVVEWLGQQLASVELTRLKYSGSDFKFTSQANHGQKLSQWMKEYTQKGFHLQRLYKRRRKTSDGLYVPTMSEIMYDDKEE